MGLAPILAGYGGTPEPKHKTPEELAKEREELNRRVQENINAIMKWTAPKNLGQVPADAIREDHK